MERNFTRRHLAGNFAAVLSRCLKYCARRLERNIIHRKVTLFALDLAFKMLVRELHRLAIDSKHGHRRPRNKRPLLRKARHIQILDGVNARITRSAARNIIGTTRHKDRRHSNRQSTCKAVPKSFMHIPSHFLSSLFKSVSFLFKRSLSGNNCTFKR